MKLRARPMTNARKYLFRPLLAFGVAAGLLSAAVACKKACQTGDCDGPSVSYYYDIEGVMLTAFSNARNAPPVLPSGATVPVANFLLELRLVTRTYAGAFAPARPAGLLPAAYAITPALPTFTEKVDSVVVSSRFDYDAQHPAGTSLNDLLDADSNYSSLATSLPGYLTEQQGKPTEQLRLRLRSAPTVAGRQQFVVRYRLRNGEIYTAQSVEVVLNY